MLLSKPVRKSRTLKGSPFPNSSSPLRNLGRVRQGKSPQPPSSTSLEPIYAVSGRLRQRSYLQEFLTPSPSSAVARSRAKSSCCRLSRQKVRLKVPTHASQRGTRPTDCTPSSPMLRTTRSSLCIQSCSNHRRRGIEKQRFH